MVQAPVKLPQVVRGRNPKLKRHRLAIRSEFSLELLVLRQWRQSENGGLALGLVAIGLGNGAEKLDKLAGGLPPSFPSRPFYLGRARFDTSNPTRDYGPGKTRPGPRYV